MKINQIIETQLDELDRRGFLKGLGAAGATAAVPGLAKGQTVPPVYLKAINDIKSFLKPKFDKLPNPMIQYKKGVIVVNMTGSKVVSVEMKESTGIQKLDDYIVRIITAAGSLPQVQSLGRTGDHQMEFTTNNLLPAPGETHTPTSQPQPQQAQPQQAQQNNTRGFTRVGNFGVISGYKLDDVKDKIIEKLLIKNPDAEVDDNGRTLTVKIHNPQSKNFGMALYKGLLGPRGSTMMVVVKFTFSERDNQIRVLPQSNIIITNAFGGVDTQPFGSSSEILDGLEKIFS